jgi:hypothetical protein
MRFVEETKDLLGNPADRIQLHDLAAKEAGDLLAATTGEHFPVSGQWSPDEFKDRLTRYEDATKDLRAVMALLTYWGEPYHRQTLALPLRRLVASIGSTSGDSVWMSSTVVEVPRSSV